MKKFKKNLKAHKKNMSERLSYNIYYHAPIYEKMVYIESNHGKDLSSNMLRIIKELSSQKNKNYKIIVYCDKKSEPRIKGLKKKYNLNFHIITHPSASIMAMEHAKYIIIDNTLRNGYTKRDGQIIVQTFNGTPLKLIGKDYNKEEHKIASLQHTMINSDYLIFPSDYARNTFLNAYMIEKIYPGKILMEGFPRNSIFFDKEKREDLKSELKLENHQIFAYMPTYREKNNSESKAKLMEILSQLDDGLKEDQTLFLKLHPKDKRKVKYSQLKHVKPFPKTFDSYEILNMADCLITDYSSVFFDYLNTGRKIILFNYDEEEYMQSHGTYIPLDELPFPKVENIEDLIDELNSSKEYDDSELIEEFCTYDRQNSTERLCKHIFTDEKVCKEEMIKNYKKNVLIFTGYLWKNGVTASLLSLLNNIDTKENNYFITFYQWDDYFKKNHREIFESFNEEIEFFPLIRDIKPIHVEKEALKKFLKGNNEDNDIVKNMFKREFKKYYGENIFHEVIQFDGYGAKNQLLYNSTNAKTTIWVHSNMIREIKTRKNQNCNSLKEAYSNYDNVVVVSPELIEPTSKISKKRDNIKIVHNLCNYEEIIEKGEKEIAINKNSIVTTSNPCGIEGVLNSNGRKFITIGRFSPEKGHERLLKAFDAFCDDYPETQLIIIGGHGALYNKTINWKNKLKHWKNVSIIQSIENPLPILKRCDLFILSSFYEGWPMVTMEAEALKVPIIETDIKGAQLLRDYNGHIIENSEEGILKGMHDFMDGKVSAMNIDFEQYNKKAVDEFYSIFSD